MSEISNDTVMNFFQLINKIVKILENMGSDIKFIKDRQDEIYIAIFGLAGKEKESDPIAKILIQLANGEITHQEALRQINKIKSK